MLVSNQNSPAEHNRQYVLRHGLQIAYSFGRAGAKRRNFNTFGLSIYKNSKSILTAHKDFERNIIWFSWIIVISFDFRKQERCTNTVVLGIYWLKFQIAKRENCYFILLLVWRADGNEEDFAGCEKMISIKSWP